MTTQLLYCPTCGAANDRDRTHCFACLSTLDTTAEKFLLHKRYRLLDQLGRGGYGAVYQVEDLLHPDVPLAMKQIHLHGLDTRQVIEATETFQRERTLLERLDHPHLPHLYDTFEDAEHWYLVSDYFPGETLEAYLATSSARLKAAPTQRTRVEESLRCGLHLCDLLHYLHTCEPAIIFRDLKPGNIIRGRAGTYALIDFGIARTVKPGQLKDTIPLGSPGYAAPEQYGRAQTDARADIYSLGAILHQMLSGDDPSEHPLHFKPLGSLDPALQRLETLIFRMVALQVEERPGSVKAVAEELRAIQQAYEQPAMRIWTPGPGQTPPWTIQSTSADSISGTGQIQQMLQPPPAPLQLKSRRRLLALLARVTLLVIWSTTPLVNRAFHGGWIVLLLGVLFLPLTALTYTVVSALAGSVTGLGWLWVAGALLLDLARYGGQTSKRRSFP